MQLTYRGTQYNVAPAFTTTVDSGLTAKYRGIVYSVQTSNAVAILPTQPLKYRGIVVGTPEVTDQQIFRPAMA